LTVLVLSLCFCIFFLCLYFNVLVALMMMMIFVFVCRETAIYRNLLLIYYFDWCTLCIFAIVVIIYRPFCFRIRLAFMFRRHLIYVPVMYVLFLWLIIATIDIWIFLLNTAIFLFCSRLMNQFLKTWETASLELYIFGLSAENAASAFRNWSWIVYSREMRCRRSQLGDVWTMSGLYLVIMSSWHYLIANIMSW
jgi:hypothetical protein